MSIGHLDLEEAANKTAGNWQDFHCFVWWRQQEIPDPENWAIVYTHHRDSGLLDWAVGHVDGFSLRVFRNGQITEAFQKYHGLAKQLDNYPVLDESDYSNREYEATVENIDLASWKLKQQFELPDGWAHSVYDWLSEQMETEIENVDDQGGSPSEEALAAAFLALGFVRNNSHVAKP